MGELKKIVSKDKRKSDRVPVSLNIFYSPVSFVGSSWKGPVVIQDLSGNGLRFLSPSLIRKKTRLNIKIVLPGSNDPVICKSEVSWTKRDAAEQAYQIGVKFNKMEDDQRRRFVGFMFQELLRQNPDLL